MPVSLDGTHTLTLSPFGSRRCCSMWEPTRYSPAWMVNRGCMVGLWKQSGSGRTSPTDHAPGASYCQIFRPSCRVGLEGASLQPHHSTRPLYCLPGLFFFLSFFLSF